MLKKPALLLALVFTCSLLRAQVKFNGNFEQLDDKGNPLGWDLTFDHRNTYDIHLDSTIKRQGKYSISISPGKSKDGYGAINFPINHTFHGKTLMLIGSIKTENVTDGWAGIWLRVDGDDKKVLQFDNMQKQALTGTNDWKEYVVRVPYNEDEALTVNAGALLAGKGKMWVDSLRLYLDDQPIEQAVIMPGHSYAADKDTAFLKGSGIDTIIVTKQNSAYLTLLGQLWGFLKYHHPAIAKGDYNWDAELFRILPSVLKCKTDIEFSKVAEHWVDMLGKPAPCTTCKTAAQIKDLAGTPHYGNLFNNTIFSKSLTGKLRYMIKNRYTGRNYYVDLGTSNAGVPQFQHEKGYAKMTYPDAGYRLLALYRYWNIINYFCPNRHLITEGWDNVLPLFIPKLSKVRNKTEYGKTMVMLIAHIHDGHAFIQNDAFEATKGQYRVPFQARFIQNKFVVTGYYKDTIGVKNIFKIGDVITAINGISIDQLLKKYLPITPASNYGAQLRDIPGNFLLRSKNAAFSFSLLRDNKPVRVKINGLEVSKTDFYSLDWNSEPKSPAYRTLNGNIGYLFAGRYKNTDLDDIKKKFAGTRGIILDLRCYPSDEMEFTLGNYLKPYVSPFVKFTSASNGYPGTFSSMLESNGDKTGEHYKGKVVILVNALTQSNAEFVTMAFQTAPNITVIGSTTAGADGNITPITLPGDFGTYMYGLGVYYPDGTCAQRKGVKINYFVEPTISGIKAGRDEVLEKAEQLIASK